MDSFDVPDGKRLDGETCKNDFLCFGIGCYLGLEICVDIGHGCSKVLTSEFPKGNKMMFEPGKTYGAFKNPSIIVNHEPYQVYCCLRSSNYFFESFDTANG